MPTVDLGNDYTSFFEPYRNGYDYVAKGTILRKGRPVKTFEARGSTLPELEKAAWVKAQQMWDTLNAPKLARGTPGPTRKPVAKKPRAKASAKKKR